MGFGNNTAKNERFHTILAPIQFLFFVFVGLYEVNTSNILTGLLISSRE